MLFHPLSVEECRHAAGIWKLSPKGALALLAETGEVLIGALDEVREIYASKPLTAEQREQVKRLGLTLAASVWLAKSELDYQARHQ